MTVADQDIDRAEADAVAWLILLREQPDDPQVQQRFELWLTAAIAHMTAWAEVAHLYDGLGSVAAATGHVLPPSVPHRLQRRPTTRALWALAACVMIAVMSALLPRFHADAFSPVGQQSMITLGDGSIARLAPDSAIDIAYSQAERRVHLLKGGGYFDVRGNRSRPFRVIAGTAEVMVVGTAFEVRMVGDDVLVGVERGRVRVREGNGPHALDMLLSPGDLLQFRDDGRPARWHIPANQIAAWREGLLIVHDRPVYEVVAQLRAYHHGIILAPDSRIARRRVTGLYHMDDPHAVLKALAMAHGGKVTQITPWVLILTDA